MANKMATLDGNTRREFVYGKLEALVYVLDIGGVSLCCRNWLVSFVVVFVEAER